jgi:hypothetical protein
MFPVLVVSRQTGNDIDLNSSSIIIARATPQSHEVFRMGMGINGSLEPNFSVPQNITIGIRGGRPMGLGPGNEMFVLSYRGRIIVGDDARAFLMNNILANGTTNASGFGPMPFAQGAFNGTNSTFPQEGFPCPRCGEGPMIRAGFNSSAGWNSSVANGTAAWVRLPPGLIGGNASGYAQCELSQGGIVQCSENESFNATAVGQRVWNGGAAGVNSTVGIPVPAWASRNSVADIENAINSTYNAVVSGVHNISVSTSANGHGGAAIPGWPAIGSAIGSAVGGGPGRIGK